MNSAEQRETEFRKNDKVRCISDSVEQGPFGPLPNTLVVGALYNVFAVFVTKARGEVLHVGHEGQYSKKHFKLVSRQMKS
jgi:hypothetical protein